jgi:hypothetical protein
VHARRKLRNRLWRRQSMIAGDCRSGRWQILSMAGIAASDVDEVIAGYVLRVLQKEEGHDISKSLPPGDRKGKGS